MKILAFIILLPLAASAATITVNSTADERAEGDGHCTLREAIDNVNAQDDTTSGDCAPASGAGDVISFDLARPATILLYDVLTIDADVTIDGSTAGPLAIDGTGHVRVFAVSATVSLVHLTIQNGLGDAGGGISNTGHLTLTSCLLIGNMADYGGGVYNDVDGTAQLTDCTWSANSAKGGGAAVYNDGTLILANCSIVGSSINYNYDIAIVGGTVYNSGTLTLSNTTLLGNAAVDGAAVYSDTDATATLRNCTLIANNAADAGAGIYNDGALTLTDCTVSGNSASDDGGGVYNDAHGTTVLTNCTLLANAADGNGGGIANTRGGTVTLHNCTLGFNAATFDGGAVYNAGMATLIQSTLQDNGPSRSDRGGGVYNDLDGTAILIACTLSGNSATGDEGGAVYNAGTLTLTGCTLTDNSAAGGRGGGVYNDAYAMATLSNCTLFGNSAGGNYYYDSRGGGGLYNDGTVSLINCTLNGNVAGGGGGLYSGDAATTTLANTIVANSTAGGNCAGGAVTDTGHNLDSDGTCAVGPATDPRLDPTGLANNGGPTQTIALLADSPAINAGDAAICALPAVNNVDQRGVVRPAPGSITCTIGAYEYPPGCCQCPASCAVPAAGSCGTCALIVGAICQDGNVCMGGTPTPAATFTPTNPPAATATPTPTPLPPTVTASPTATALPSFTALSICTGDCDGTNTVEVNEIVTLVAMALGTQTQLSACPHGIAPGVTDVSQIDVAVILTAVNHALDGCGG